MHNPLDIIIPQVSALGPHVVLFDVLRLFDDYYLESFGPMVHLAMNEELAVWVGQVDIAVAGPCAQFSSPVLTMTVTLLGDASLACLPDVESIGSAGVSFALCNDGGADQLVVSFR